MFLLLAYGCCGLNFAESRLSIKRAGAEQLQTAGVLRAPLSLRLFLRYFGRAKRIRLRTFEKVLAALRPPNTGQDVFAWQMLQKHLDLRVLKAL
ncbi:hypothetical protein DWQ65_11865 [Treponema phagedenis]|nr:hypothetical protein [Treponema phagedenis]NVP23626.1 hypothetical protein [Treponema phagedenis]QEK01584.1 hypothetical protein FUT84_10725 [Treponema phagedenis]QEK04263.1 hypothetical protein FUT83_10920 [Treponema phagedenis]QEK09877.1 hypothetical protein FUT81_10825 [Treponema phagedenis]QKS91117.1 hypothetical protein HPJ96_04260 [Treponema phagedenis]